MKYTAYNDLKKEENTHYHPNNSQIRHIDSISLFFMFKKIESDLESRFEEKWDSRAFDGGF